MLNDSLIKYKYWCQSIFSTLNIQGKESTQRKSLFTTIKELDFSLTLHWFWNTSMQRFWNTSVQNTYKQVKTRMCGTAVIQRHGRCWMHLLQADQILSRAKAEFWIPTGPRSCCSCPSKLSRWKDCLFWSLSAPFGSTKTSMELLSVCSCLTQVPLLSFHLQRSLLRQLCYFSLLFHQSHYGY